MRRGVAMTLAVAVGLGSGGSVWGTLDRHARWAKHFARGPKITLAAATFFGARGHEELVACGSQADGKKHKRREEFAAVLQGTLACAERTASLRVPVSVSLVEGRDVLRERRRP